MEVGDGICSGVPLKSKQLLRQREDSFSTLAQQGIRYEQVLGEGSYAKVVAAYHMGLKDTVAVKITDKRKAPEEYVEKFLQREIKLLCELDHPNIVKVLAIFESIDKIFIVMDLCSGGDLLEFVNQKKYRDEQEKKKHFQQIASAICYCHEQGIIHRDLKLENLLLDSEGNIKVTDFGFARRGMNLNNIDTYCGSFAYACPAILRGEPYNGYAADIWSMGIILYAITTYRLPFNEADLKMFSSNNTFKKLKFTKETSIEVRDLVRKMLEVDSTKRIIAREVLNHDWISKADSRDGIGKDPQVTRAVSTTTEAQVEREIASEKTDQVQEDAEKQFQIVAARRSIVTSSNSNKVLANVVRANPVSSAGTMKKKRASILCIGQLGRKRTDKIKSDSTCIQSGDPVGSLVSQTVKVKTKLESEDPLNGKKSDRVGTPAKAAKRGAKPLLDKKHLEPSQAIKSKKEANEPKLHKWTKKCSKLSAKE